MNKKLLLRNIATILLIFGYLLAQSQGVDFIVNDFKKAQKVAQQESKLIFIDTYASWCTQCKKMDVLFQDPEVASLLNQGYINLKVNMDQKDQANLLNRYYNIFFLPTLIFSDQEGNVFYQMDRAMNKQDFISAIKSINPNGYSTNARSTYQSNPFGGNTLAKAPVTKQKSKEVGKNKKVEKKIVESIPLEDHDPSTEKILHVLDETAGMPPPVLYQEAYFRMQLMDGSEQSTAQAYLKTQKDWSTEKNMRFIHDFLVTTDSYEFDYYIINRHKFKELIGEQQVNQTIQILVNRKLYQGFPRPDFKESKALLSYIDPQMSRVEALRYYVIRTMLDDDREEFKKYASQYLRSVNANDDRVYAKLANIALYEAKEEASLDIAIDQINKAISLKDNNHQYYFTKANLLLQKGVKSAARKAAQRSLDLAMNQGLPLTNINKLISRINKL